MRRYSPLGTSTATEGTTKIATVAVDDPDGWGPQLRIGLGYVL